MDPASEVSKKSQNDLYYHIDRKCTAQNLMLLSSLIFVTNSFRVYASRQQKNAKQRFPIKTAIAELDKIFSQSFDANLTEELHSCQPFHVDFALEVAQHKVLNYALENPTESVVNETLDHFFRNRKNAAEVNRDFRFNLKNFKVEGSRYFYADETIP